MTSFTVESLFSHLIKVGLFHLGSKTDLFQTAATCSRGPLWGRGAVDLDGGESGAPGLLPGRLTLCLKGQGQRRQPGINVYIFDFSADGTDLRTAAKVQRSVRLSRAWLHHPRIQDGDNCHSPKSKKRTLDRPVLPSAWRWSSGVMFPGSRVIHWCFLHPFIR